MIVHTDPEENVITMIMLMVMVIQMYVQLTNPEENVNNNIGAGRAGGPTYS